MRASVIAVPLAFFPQLQDSFALGKACLLALVVAFGAPLAVAVSSGSIGGFRRPELGPILAFVCLNALAVLTSVVPITSLLGYSERYQGFLTIVLYVATYFVVVNAINDDGEASGLVRAVCVGAVLISAYGVVQHFRLDPIRWVGADDRVFSTLGHPNTLAAYLSMVIPLAVWLAVRAQGPCRDLWAIALGMMLLCLLFTAGRAGLLAIAISSCLMGLLWARTEHASIPLKSLIVVLAVGFVVLVATLLAPPSRAILANVANRASAAVTASDSASKGRIELLVTGIAIVRDHPTVGIGQDTLQLVYPRYRSPTYAVTEGLNVTPTKVHNDLLDKAVTIGVPGLAAYVLLLGRFARLMLTSILASTNSNSRGLLIALFGSWVAYLAQSLFGFGEVATTWLFWLVMGTCAAVAAPTTACSRNRQVSFRACGEAYAGQKRTEAPYGAARGRMVVVLCIVTLAGAFVWYLSIRAVAADFASSRGADLSSRFGGSAALSQYREAVRLNPYERRYRDGLAVAFEQAAHDSADGPALLLAAAAEYRAVLSQQPDDAYAHLKLARVSALLAAISQANVTETLHHADEAARLDPNNPVLRVGVASVYRSLGLPREAETHLLAATELAPYVDAYLALGSMYRDEQQYELALDAYKSASLLLYTADVQFLLGRAYLESGHQEEAELALKTALDLEPSNSASQALYSLARRR